MGKSKIVFGNEVLIDLTADTVTKEKLLKGYTAHGADGEVVAGECAFDVDSSECTAKPSEVLSGKTFAKGGQIHTGDMVNNGGVTGVISTKGAVYSIPQGFHDGSGTVAIDSTEQSKLVPGNIKQGVTILGVVGSHEGGTVVNAQSKEVTPAKTSQTVIPDSGYDYLSQVTVLAIPYVESENAAGGTTVTIG